MPTTPKIQRWIDLIAALLARRMPATFDVLARDVPGYLADGSVAAGRPSGAVKRMFERDKRELRALGVPLETVGEEGSEHTAYRLAAREFYLPYLAVATPRGRSEPRRVDRFGYHALRLLTFGPEELAAVADAARRARELGDPALAADAESAARKLAFDLPLDASAGADVHIVQPRARPDPRTLELLGEALLGRKRVTFDYHTMGTDTRARRTVEPYGLFFLDAHWYLAARDVEKGELRNFRVSRIARVEPNGARADTPDYEIPAGFRLREHARSRQAWELGDGDAVDAVVEFRSATGVTLAAAALGGELPGEPGRRTFRVRRPDAFARWLLSFAGEARPVAPPEIVDAYARLVAGTRALYAGGTR